MFVILFGISFGAWKITVDIQKLKIIPADNLPIIIREMNLSSSDLLNKDEVNYYQNSINNNQGFDLDIVETGKTVPKVTFRDGPIADLQLEDIGVLGLNSTKLDLPISNTMDFTTDNVVIKFDYGPFPEFDILSTDKITSDILVENNRNNRKNYENPTLGENYLGPYDGIIDANIGNEFILNIFAVTIMDTH